MLRHAPRARRRRCRNSWQSERDRSNLQAGFRPASLSLYIYAPEPLANELKSLHGFVGEVLARSAQGPLDGDTICSLGEKHALRDYLQAIVAQQHAI
ncbi:hypothetical protein Tamer19_13370 [Cupriavidus sp. TA19]|nr:hypothetical protein Tamer19_13370 [Cupriavidus sp. TA19]